MAKLVSLTVGAGVYLHEGSPETTQFQLTYLDVGLELNALLSENAEGMQLTAKIVQSALKDARIRKR